MSSTQQSDSAKQEKDAEIVRVPSVTDDGLDETLYGGSPDAPLDDTEDYDFISNTPTQDTASADKEVEAGK